MLVAPRADVDQPVDQQLRAVLDHREAAGAVAVERRVADRHLGLVAGRQDQPAELVGHRHQQVAADAGLEVLLGDVLLAIAEDGGEHAVIELHRLGDRQLVARDAEVLGQHARVALGARGRIGRGHDHRGDLLGAERVDGDGRHERGVDAAAEPEDDVLEAVLAHVVARAEHERGVDLGVGVEQVDDLAGGGGLGGAAGGAW